MFTMTGQTFEEETPNREIDIGATTSTMIMPWGTHHSVMPSSIWDPDCAPKRHEIIAAHQMEDQNIVTADLIVAQWPDNSFFYIDAIDREINFVDKPKKIYAFREYESDFDNIEYSFSGYNSYNDVIVNNPLSIEIPKPPKGYKVKVKYVALE